MQQVTGGADLFVGFGGVVQRPAVASAADWYVQDFGVLSAALKRYTVRHLLGCQEQSRVERREREGRGTCSTRTDT